MRTLDMIRKGVNYFWDEDLYQKYKRRFLFRKPVLFAQHKNGVIAPIFQADPPKEGKYTGEKLRQLRAERGVGRPPHIVAAKREKLLEGCQA